MAPLGSWDEVRNRAFAMEDAARVVQAIAFFERVLGQRWEGLRDSRPFANTMLTRGPSGRTEVLRLAELLWAVPSDGARMQLAREVGAASFETYRAACMALQWGEDAALVGGDVDYFAHNASGKIADLRVRFDVGRWIAIECLAMSASANEAAFMEVLEPLWHRCAREAVLGRTGALRLSFDGEFDRAFVGALRDRAEEMLANEVLAEAEIFLGGHISFVPDASPRRIEFDPGPGVPDGFGRMQLSLGRKAAQVEAHLDGGSAPACVAGGLLIHSRALLTGHSRSEVLRTGNDVRVLLHDRHPKLGFVVAYEDAVGPSEPWMVAQGHVIAGRTYTRDGVLRTFIGARNRDRYAVTQSELTTLARIALRAPP